MSFEDEIFLKRKVILERLESFGFVKNEVVYIYKRTLLNEFLAIVQIDKLGEVKGTIYDLSSNEEYVNYRNKNFNGEFVNRVRNAYQILLEEIAEACSIKRYFITDQANRITSQIDSLYHSKPEFLWDDDINTGVFRSPINQKWFGYITFIKGNKLDEKLNDSVEILTIKLLENNITELLKKEGFYPAYHMNKKHWITILLNDFLSDEFILDLVKESFNLIH